MNGKTFDLNIITVVSRLSAHGRLNVHVTRDFGLHGGLPGIKIPEAATVAP